MDLSRVKEYMEKSLEEHGTTSWGVGWNSKEGQTLRFQKLLQMIDNPIDERFSLNDLGCGYGALLQYLIDKDFCLEHYYGYDISQNMLNAAKDIIYKNKTLVCAPKLQTIADYSVVSGVFNAIFDRDKQEWQEYILETLRNLNEFSKKGFSFNLLTDFVDYEAENLYYANPCYFFEFCRKNFSRKVALLHDYDLWEWTIIVKK